MKSIIFILTCAVLGVGAAFLTFNDAPTPPLHPEIGRADTVLIDKARHRLTLMRKEEVLAKFRVAVAPQSKAPGCAANGVYEISQRNPKRLYRLSLGLEGTDRRIAALIHGAPRVPQAALSLFSKELRGCISVTNDQMREIWSRVTIGTEVIIR